MSDIKSKENKDKVKDNEEITSASQLKFNQGNFIVKKNGKFRDDYLIG